MKDELYGVPTPEIYRSQSAKIADAHHRGLSIAQLEQLGNFITEVLKTYVTHDKLSGKIVTPQNINLYHICDLFIKPLSENDECSFVEIIAPKTQEPSWFVSHWWGTSFFDTLRMLKLHAKERNVSHEDEFYWICAFANNQHNLEDLEEMEDYRDTPFFKAITEPKCRGNLLLLDENMATPFTRSWCVFEAFVLNKHGREERPTNPLLMDTATIVPPGLCESSDRTFNERCAALNYDIEEKDGLVYTDNTSDHPGDPDRAWFPTIVSMMGVKIDISKAEASREADRRTILRWVGDNADEVNASLQRRFLRPAIYQAATDIGKVKVLRELMESPLLTKEQAVQLADEEECVADLAEYNYSSPESDFAKETGTDHHGCLKYLLGMGCDPNGRNEDGILALDIAMEINNFHNVRLLLEHNADIALMNEDLITSSCPDDISKVFQDHEERDERGTWCCVLYNKHLENIYKK
jgi:hypothetical protein